MQQEILKAFLDALNSNLPAGIVCYDDPPQEATPPYIVIRMMPGEKWWGPRLPGLEHTRGEFTLQLTSVGTFQGQVLALSGVGRRLMVAREPDKTFSMPVVIQNVAILDRRLAGEPAGVIGPEEGERIQNLPEQFIISAEEST